MFFIYDFVAFIYGLVYLPYLLITKRAYPGFEMRFGFFSDETKEKIAFKGNIWVHAVSVGEVIAVNGFIDQLRARYPHYQVVLTSTTKTGYEFARQRLADKALVLPSPIDFSFVTATFIDLIKPQIYIAVETEIWPNLYRNLHRQDIPLLVINGRISDRSYGRYKAISFFLKVILNQASRWCMQSQKDAQRIIDLGADPTRVTVTGNIKFDELPKEELPMAQVPHALELLWVAGSTHPGEEDIVLSVYDKIIKVNPQWRLVIAPRHIERVPQVIDSIAHWGLKSQRYSKVSISGKNGIWDADRSVMVVDTIGDLRFLYAMASLVFVGKSLTVGGGHNIIEPAFYGKAIVIGPMTENFRDIVACFKEGHAIVEVQDATEFESAVKILSGDLPKREALGKAARQVITQNQGAAERSLQVVAEFLK